MLSRRDFDKLGDRPDINLAWNLVGKKIVSSFGGEPLIPIPYFHYKKSPCAPGFLAIKKEKKLNELLTRQPKRFLFTEGLWDFQPIWARHYRILRTSSKMENIGNFFVYEKCRTHKGRSKHIRVEFLGKEMSSLDEEPFNMSLDLEPFDNLMFGDFKTYIVDKIFSIDSGFIEVGIDDQIDRVHITSRFPIGFTMMKLNISYNDGVGEVESMSEVNARKWRGVWFDRSKFRALFYQIMSNQRKYGKLIEASASFSSSTRFKPYNIRNREAL